MSTATIRFAARWWKPWHWLRLWRQRRIRAHLRGKVLVVNGEARTIVDYRDGIVTVNPPFSKAPGGATTFEIHKADPPA